MIHILEQLQKLTNSGKKLSNVNGFEDLYEVVFNLTRDLFDNDRAAILLKDKTDGSLTIAASRGYDGDAVRKFKSGATTKGITGYVFETGTPELVAETISDPRYVKGVENAVSEMAVPLRTPDGIVGVLDMESPRTAFTTADLALFTTFGEQVATAVRNLTLQMGLEQRARKLVSISKAGQSITTVSTVAEILSRIMDLTTEALELNNCAVQLFDESGEHLVVIAAKGYEDNPVGLKIRKGQGVTGRTAASRRPSLIPDVQKIDHYIPGIRNCRSEMAVPLIYRDDVIGVFNVEHKEPDKFDETDLLLTSIFADQAAGAIGNAQRREKQEITVEKLKKRNRELELIVQTSTKVNAITDLDLLLDEVLNMTVKALGVKRISVLLPDESGLTLKVRKTLFRGDSGGSDSGGSDSGGSDSGGSDSGGSDSGGSDSGGGHGANLDIPIENSITGEAYRVGTPILVPDVKKEPRYIAALPGGRSEIVAPMIVGNDVVGVLDAESVNKPLSQDDLKTLELLADQVAVAVRNVKQRKDLQERNRRLRLIHEAACSLNRVEDPEQMLESILKATRKAIGVKSVAILTPDDAGTHLVVQKALDHGDVEGLKIPVGEGFVGRMFVSGKAGIIDDIADTEDYIGGTPGARSEMAVPLVLEDSIIGILDAESDKPYAFNASHLDMFRIFGSQTATALRSALYIERLKRRGNRLAQLNRINRDLLSIHDHRELIDRILESAMSALEHDRCALLLVDPVTRDLVVDSAPGYGDVAGMRIPMGKGITGHVAANGDPLLVGDTSADDRYMSGKSSGQCEMAVPIQVHGEVIGVLDAESSRVNAFTQSDLDIFATFASQAGVAIHNTRLILGLETANKKLSANVKELGTLNKKLENYSAEIADTNKALEWQIDNLTAVHEAGKTITSSLDLDTTLETILDMSSKIVGSTAGAIKLMDSESKELQVRAESGTVSDISGSFSLLDLPLMIGNKTIGVFELVNKTGGEIGDDEQQMLETMASQAAIAIENARLFEDTKKIYYETLKSLAKALEARDHYTKGHSERVAALAKNVAEELGLDEPERLEIYDAALLHDIGKIGIRDEVLLAPRKLNREEMETIRKHPTFGNAILRPLKFLGAIREHIRNHHERWDGAGYPDGRAGEDIPLASRIIAVADTFDAMTSNRPYRDKLTETTAIKEISNAAGTQFDPRVVAAFLKVIES